MIKPITFKNILNYLLKILLFISIIAVVVAGIFFYKGSIIDQVDQFIVSKYVGKYQQKLETAKQLISIDTVKSNYAFVTLLSDLEPIKAMDRLAPIKRQTLTLLTENLIESGDIERALFWSELWVQFNDQDLLALAQRAKLVYLTQGRKEEGLILLTELYRKVPEAQIITDTYADALEQEGKLSEAFLSLSRSLTFNGSPKENAWQIYWDKGQGFNPKDMHVIRTITDKENKVVLNFELDGGTKNLRLDPPSYSRLSFFDPKVLITAGGRRETVHLADVPLQFHNMSQYGKRVQTSGGIDPYVFWKMPESPLHETKAITIELSLDVVFPDKMIRLVTSEDGDAIETDLLAKGEMLAVEHLKSIRKQSREQHTESMMDANKKLENLLFGQSLEVYWRKSGSVFSEKQKNNSQLNCNVVDEKVSFDILIPIHGTPDELRLDFPDIKGVSYNLKQMEIVQGENAQEIDVANLAFTLKNNVKKEGNVIEVLGNDPHFAFKVNELRFDSVVHVVGFVQ
ncbi:MAG: tetratricopeptide (TPR) repeat protein [Desulforhopalus sp.]|jgi:tetratricopeptide (TPR) repeat protein